MKRNLLLCLFFITIALQAQTQMQQLGSHTFDNIINDVWGYHANDKEYALVGVQNGFSIIDVTDPENTEELFLQSMKEIWNDQLLTDRYLSGTSAIQIVDYDLFYSLYWYDGGYDNYNAIEQELRGQMRPYLNGYIEIIGT